MVPFSRKTSPLGYLKICEFENLKMGMVYMVMRSNPLYLERCRQAALNLEPIGTLAH